MLEDYKSALRAGQRAYRARIARGQSPYLAVLDDVLKGVDIGAAGAGGDPVGQSCGHQDQRTAHCLFV